MERTRISSKALSMVVFVALMIATSSSHVFAAGTLAGTAISNQATVNYNSGTNARTSTSLVVSIHVAHKVSASYSPGSAASIGVDSLQFYVPVVFTQTGNRGDNFNIASVLTKSVNLAKYTVEILNDVAHNGVYNGVDLPITNTGYIAPDGAKYMLLHITVAAETADNDSVLIATTLTSQAANNTTDTVVTNSGAGFTYYYSYKVQKPVFAFSVSQTTVTTTNASKLPGQSITYQVSVQNTGHAAPTANTEIHWRHSVANMPYTSTTGTLAADSVAGDKVFTLTPAQTPAGQVSAITFNIVHTIDQTQNTATGVPAGTTINMVDPTLARVYVKITQAAANYKWYNATGGPFPIVVGTASGALWTATPVNQSGNPTDSAKYSFTFKNTGNSATTFNLTNTLNVGGLDVAHVFSLTNVIISIAATPSVAAGATQTVWVAVGIPVTATDAQTIRRNIIATPASGTDAPTGGTNTASYTTPLITSVTAPTITVTLSDSLVSGAGTVTNPAPGDVVMWRIKITNSGSGNATSISSSNVGYLHATSNLFVASSIDVDLTGVLALAGAWGVQGNNGTAFSGGTASVSGGLVTVQFTPLAAGTSAQYRYKVAIQ